MKLIDSIRIKYFRSIYDLSLDAVEEITVISGRNDAGKSNILKALNLFFNNETDPRQYFEFENDYSFKRLDEVRKTIKTKQFVEIQIDFIRGDRYEKTLPPTFSVTKRWYRTSFLPDIKSNIEKQFEAGHIKTKQRDRAQASLQRFLNSIKFEYVPAIKDREYFSYLLSRLQGLIFDQSTKDSPLLKAVEDFNKIVAAEAHELRNEFLQVTKIPTDIRLPEAMDELFGAFNVQTESGSNTLPITFRGDGIRSRFVPSLLHYLSNRSRYHYIWGFEEPENSLEHLLALELANAISTEYSKGSQVFITSHSPAFIIMPTPKSVSYRASRDSGATQISTLNRHSKIIDTATYNRLYDEIGLSKLKEEYSREYADKVEELNRKITNLEAIKAEFQKSQLPVLLTEGTSEALLLQLAWRKLYRSSIPYNIISCETGDSNASSGGYGQLKTAIESVRTDEPHTVALFDYDHDAYKSFQKINNTFIDARDLGNVKIHADEHCAAAMLPAISNRVAYYEAVNLPLEFYFEDADLNKRKGNKGLRFENAIVKSITHTGHLIETTVSDLPHLRLIRGDKIFFAQEIAVTFPQNSFENFRVIFDFLSEIYSRLK